MKRVVVALCALLMPLGAATVTAAQDLPSSVTRRAVRAAVKITSESGPGEGATGSGSIIDPRGYVLTNFHVVGHTHPGNGAPGTLINTGNEVRLAMVTTPRENAQTRYLGRVVRADARLDLALIRIISDMDGNPIPRSQRFPSVPIADTSRLRPGSRLFAFGFPLGVRTINVTSGEMSGFQMNSRDEVAWIRTDAEFNPGNSGGMLLDRTGRLVAVPTAVLSGRGTLEPIELARPVERIPDEWRRAMRGREIEDVQIGGVPELPLDTEFVDEAVGDSSAFDRPEMHYYRLPAERPLRINISPGLAVGLLTAEGRVLREGRGQVAIAEGDPADMVLAVLIPPRADSGGGTLAIRIRARRGNGGLPGWELPPPGGRNAAPPAQRRFPVMPGRRQRQR
ncbi:MAG: S1C family serine protease [Sandaracinaceae bacterium]